MKLIAVINEKWDAKRDVIRRDVAERGFEAEMVDIAKEEEGKPAKVIGHELHIKVPEKVTKEDRRTELLQSRLETMYKLKVTKARG